PSPLRMNESAVRMSYWSLKSFVFLTPSSSPSYSAHTPFALRLSTTPAVKPGMSVTRKLPSPFWTLKSKYSGCCFSTCLMALVTLSRKCWSVRGQFWPLPEPLPRWHEEADGVGAGVGVGPGATVVGGTTGSVVVVLVGSWVPGGIVATTPPVGEVGASG